MGKRSRWDGSRLRAIGLDDNSTVVCNGVRDLLHQYCKCVDAGRTPKMAILEFLASGFDCVLGGGASLDEAFGLRRDRSGRHKQFRGRLPAKNNLEAVRLHCRDMRLARLVDELQREGTKRTEAYKEAAATESKSSSRAVSASTARRAYARFKAKRQRYGRLAPAMEVLSGVDLDALMLSFVGPMDAHEARYKKLNQRRQRVALQAAHECGYIYGVTLGAVDEDLMTDLLWGDDQLLGPQQILDVYFRESAMTEDEAKREWCLGFRKGVKARRASPRKVPIL